MNAKSCKVDAHLWLSYQGVNDIFIFVHGYISRKHAQRFGALPSVSQKPHPVLLYAQMVVVHKRVR